ncbi:protein lap1 [Teleopsis dalmanni]|uniref:protein lap1 n=1 Tax=Teleopsis dalmanni TaxID=139649 RepID=UPI0018CEBE08|nr:protein lap1 [Teleopsis dalmanni]XP_037946400.1 protein lap1 [Teleopsis dalmanni]XP_037946401.1 protein lap1 [Teleopsis dalmanni]
MSLRKCFPCLQFRNEEVITKLNYSNKVLTDEFPEVWEHERTLEELQLISARLNSLPPQLFYCKSLRILNVSNNNLETIPTAIGSLRQLQNLDLSRNLICNVPDNIKSCKNLTYLDLSCNNLQRLPDAVTSLITLQELLLNSTCLEFLPANFGRLVNLKILELRLNNLITLPKSIARLCNLQRLDIGANEFTELPEVVGELKQLRELWADLNQIRRMPPNIGKLHELQHLELNGNLLDTLPNEVGQLSNLDVLSVCSNNLTSLPFSIGNMKSLVLLKCEYNDLRELPDSISNLINLEEFVLSHNQILRLPATIGMLRKLRFLFVDNNELITIPEEISSCTNLSILSVSYNKLKELPQNIGHLTGLKVLNLVHNQICTLPVSILSLVNLTSLWISDNQSQPLVPLQYLDAGTKTQLTCFMLPQVRLSTVHFNNYNQEAYDFYNSTSDQQQQSTSSKMPTGASTCSGGNISSKHICFAEEATVMNGTTEENETAKISIVEVQPNEVGLMRSSTPHPKELRLMAKYLRNSQQKLPNKPPEFINIKEARVMSNTSNNCDNLNQTLGTSATNENALTDNQQQYSVHELAHPAQLQFMYGVPEQIIQYEPIYYQQQLTPVPISMSMPVTVSNNCAEQQNVIYPQMNDVNNYQIYDYKQQEAQQLLSSYDYDTNNLPLQPINEPPPYHIARAFTKKTPKDLTDYETIRNQQQKQQLYEIQQQQMQMQIIQQQQQQQQQQHQKQLQHQIQQHQQKDQLQDLQQQVSQQKEDITFDYENNIREMETANLSTPNGIQPVYIHSQQLKQNDNELYTTNASATEDIANSHTQLKSNQQPNNVSKEIAIPNHSTTESNNNTNSGEKSKTQKKAWLFGTHKNPTVKQVVILWENHIGFEIAELPDKNGIYVSSTVPNTSAARLLFVNDKLLEIDGHDFSNISITEAKDILSNAGAMINIMLSRH